MIRNIALFYNEDIFTAFMDIKIIAIDLKRELYLLGGLNRFLM